MKISFSAAVMGSLMALTLSFPTAAQQTASAVAAVPPETVPPEKGPPVLAGPVHLSAADAVAEALAANPGLKAIGHQNLAAERSARAAARTRWGRLDAVFNYDRFNDAVIVRSMSRELFAESGDFSGLPWDRNQQHYGLTFELPLYMGGTLSSGIKIARLEAARTTALLEGTRWQLRFNVISLYTSAQTLDAVETSLDQLVSSLAKTGQRLDLAVKLGKRPELDRLKVVEQVEEAKAEREAVRADRVKVGAMLLALMGREPVGGIEVDPLPEQVPVPVLSHAQIRAAAAGVSPIRQAKLTAEQSSRRVALASASFRPTVFAQGNYMRNAAPSLGDPLDTWQVSVRVKVPLFHGASRFEELAAAKQRRNSAVAGVEQTRLTVAAELEDALARFRSAQASLEAARARVAAGNEAARIEEIRYETGAGVIEDLLYAQAREEGARASLALALGATITAAERINSIVEKESVK